MFNGKREFDRHNLGVAGPGSFIIWHNDPHGAVKVPIQQRPNNKKVNDVSR